LLPAVQSARESARRAQCANNLKQLALAAATYMDCHETLPMGYTFQRRANNPSRLTSNHSLFVALLPYYDQQALFNSVNFDVNIYNAPNFTIHSVALGMLCCPSDAAVPEPKILPSGSLLDTGDVKMYYTSYAGNTGTWQYFFQQDPIPQTKMN